MGAVRGGSGAEQRTALVPMAVAVRVASRRADSRTPTRGVGGLDLDLQPLLLAAAAAQRSGLPRSSDRTISPDVSVQLYLPAVAGVSKEGEGKNLLVYFHDGGKLSSPRTQAPPPRRLRRLVVLEYIKK
ncbi:hypothetical protein E2562_010770 [Oryza meyeriana var. granulata]|uniref:Uncharacterized protein n=1 Tax=Oryza meyeriana var. granulata TaxID=110450 RepID=A0A6G1EW91_9ORYZ|nr:hypothetical protein E2562_010770 [Oryza meyeriana var. granulata]